MDTVPREIRSKMMAGIKGKDTAPELLIRKALHAKGFRYRLYGKDLPGKPDMVFPGRHAVLFIHGCFWHGHDCSYFKIPLTNPGFWANKILENQSRDIRVLDQLHALGWRVAVIWECALRGKAAKESLGTTVTLIGAWLNEGILDLAISGPMHTEDSIRITEVISYPNFEPWLGNVAEC